MTGRGTGRSNESNEAALTCDDAVSSISSFVRPPLPEAARYSLAGDVVQAIEPHTEADPAALLLSYLVVLGIACGSSGLVVLDLDVAEGMPDGRAVFWRLCRRRGLDRPPQTFMVRTPRGGVHLYFAALDASEIRNSAGKVGVCIDVRARGGYVIGPGSVIGRRVYEVATTAAVAPLPEWLAGLAEPSVMPPAPALHAPPPSRPRSRRGGAELVLFVANLAVGERNNGLFWAASRAAETGRADVLGALVFAATAAGLPEDEAWRTVRSALERRAS
jgi:hypothetical protein